MIIRYQSCNSLLVILSHALEATSSITERLLVILSVSEESV